jgi:hypothetical protein
MEELLTEIERMKIDITVVTETKKKGTGSMEIGGKIFLYSGVEKNRRAASGEGIILNQSRRKRITAYTWASDRIIKLKLKTVRNNCLIIRVYAPVEGNKQETEDLYKQLQDCINTAGKNDYVVAAGDLNARTGNLTVPELIGHNGEIKLNGNGKCLRDWCTFNNLRITNTFFNHKDIHKYTWEARGTKSIIDHIIANEKIWPKVMEIRVYRRAEIDTDHYFLISKIKIPKRYVTKKNKK